MTSRQDIRVNRGIKVEFFGFTDSSLTHFSFHNTIVSFFLEDTIHLNVTIFGTELSVFVRHFLLLLFSISEIARRK